MQELMKEVRYAQILRPYESKFNCVSEFSGEGEVFKDIGGVLTLDMCRSHKYDDLFLKMVEVNFKEREKSLKELKDEATQWLSVWQTVANCNKKSLTFTFFEDDSLTFTYKL